MTAHCHKLVRKVAQEAAGELYQLLMHDNQLHLEWQRQNPGLSARALEVRFIAKNWSRCIPFARATMARMLASSIDSDTKDTIMEALALDSTLVRGRAQAAQIGAFK